MTQKEVVAHRSAYTETVDALLLAKGLMLCTFPNEVENVNSLENMVIDLFNKYGSVKA